jgi:tRNA A-37 threonylcarbamoyl transferase component Bud32
MKRIPVPRAVMDLLLQGRNKTVHGAYESSFYEDHVDVVETAVRWLLGNTPLWDVQLVQVTKPSQGRLLHGTRPTKSVALAEEFDRDQLLFRLGEEVWPVMPLIHTDEGHTYVANGSWRAADASAEFLCHSLAAQHPGQGTLRIPLPDLTRPPLPGVGQIVDGHYRITAILGQGADAVVYLAVDTGEDTEYVLKAFREPRDSFDQRRAEFTALQRINHPSIPRVHEIHGWEHPFHLRMDHVAGVALKARREEFQSNVSAVTRLGIALCEALDAVHSAGFVHRDVAPDNILIPDRADDPIRLVDFDLVAEEGVVGPAGTSVYRPPESELGTPWTKSSDVYSLGVLLFELLTGRLPYETREEGAPPRFVKHAASERDAFGGILNVLLKAASPKPHARYPDARRLLQALRRAHKPPAAQPGY